MSIKYGRLWFGLLAVAPACVYDSKLGGLLDEDAGSDEPGAADTDGTVGSANAGDGSGPPVSPEPDPSQPYPYCEWGGPNAYEQWCPPTAGAWGYLNWHVEGASSSYCENDDACNACVCYASCDEGVSECPVPDSGTAQPECLGNSHTCMLTCDAGEACPDGMSCVDMLEFSRLVCAWVRDDG